MKTKVTWKILTLVGTLLSVSSSIQAQAVVQGLDQKTDLPAIPYRSEMGGQISLQSLQGIVQTSTLSQFTIQYQRVAFNGSEKVRLRFYHNDGPSVGSGIAAPQSVFLDSSWISVETMSPPSSEPLDSMMVIPLNNQVVPRTFAWTLEFTSDSPDAKIFFPLYRAGSGSQGISGYWARTPAGTDWEWIAFSQGSLSLGAILQGSSPTLASSNLRNLEDSDFISEGIISHSSPPIRRAASGGDVLFDNSAENLNQKISYTPLSELGMEISLENLGFGNTQANVDEISIDFTQTNFSGNESFRIRFYGLSEDEAPGHLLFDTGMQAAPMADNSLGITTLTLNPEGDLLLPQKFIWTLSFDGLEEDAGEAVSLNLFGRPQIGGSSEAIWLLDPEGKWFLLSVNGSSRAGFLTQVKGVGALDAAIPEPSTLLLIPLGIFLLRYRKGK